MRIQTDDGISNPFLLAIGQLPQVVEKEDNSTFETAQKIPDPPLVVEGQVAGNDVDFFRFHGKKGQAIFVDAQCARIGSGVDPSIRLTAAGQTGRTSPRPMIRRDWDRRQADRRAPRGRRLRRRAVGFAIPGRWAACVSAGHRRCSGSRGSVSAGRTAGRDGGPRARGAGR